MRSKHQADIESKIRFCKDNGLEPRIEFNVYDGQPWVRGCLPSRTVLVKK